MVIRGGIPAIVRNDAGCYEGNLVSYFQILWNHAQNLNNPYHNFRHICHVLWLCHEACLYYTKYYPSELTLRQKRNLLIAALFHDFDHTGKSGPDWMNIAIAMRAIDRFLLPEDRPYRMDISRLVSFTEYPYAVGPEDLDLSALILRDADMGQAFSVAWIQQVIFGLAAEWGKTPLEVVKMQGPFHEKVRFHTKWGQKMFPASDVRTKINEATELLELLTTEPVLA